MIDCTWWGHSTASVGIGGARVVTDPLLGDRLLHLKRYAASPGPEADVADLILISHLHRDHCDVRSLVRFRPEVPIVAPRGAHRVLRGLVRGLGRELIEVAPGDDVEVAGVQVQVLAATHDGRRHPLTRSLPPALGFRFGNSAATCWYPGDTEHRADMAEVAEVDLALVPVGGWGPTLATGHLDPEQAADAVRSVGARWAIPVHWGTFWPAGLARVMPANHRRLFVEPARRFADALRDTDIDVQVLRPGESVRLPSA